MNYVTAIVYVSLGCRQIKSSEEEEEEKSVKRQSSNLQSRWQNVQTFRNILYGLQEAREV